MSSPTPTNIGYASFYEAYQNYGAYSASVVVSGSVGAAGYIEYVAEIETGRSVPEFTGMVNWGRTTTPTSGPSYSVDGFLQVDSNEGSTPGFSGATFSLYPRVEANGTKLRCIVAVNNPYSDTLSYPTFTFAFTVRALLPPQ